MSCLHFIGALALDLTSKGTSDDRVVTPDRDLALEGLRNLASATGIPKHDGPSELPPIGGKG